MAKYPREEISYKKLYKKLDLNRELKIEWPTMPESGEICLIDEGQSTRLTREEFISGDEFDEQFCQKNNIKMAHLQGLFKKLDRYFISWVFKKLDRIKPRNSTHPCEICGRRQLKNKQQPIECQGCLVTVHEACYGVDGTPGRRWLCRRCIFHYEEKQCKFCNGKDGAMKKTSTNEWCHVVCALLTQGVFFSNMETKDPIDITDAEGLEGICSVCKETSKFLIKCAYSGCETAYHASCAAKTGYCDIGNALSYCNDHNPLKTTKTIRSRRNILKNFDSYPEMTHEVLIREIGGFLVPKKTSYSQLVTEKPRIMRRMRIKYGKWNNFDVISKYWHLKRSALGYYFDDCFMFPNHFRF